MTIRCAIVGSGNIAWRYDEGGYDGRRSITHAACFDRHSETELVGICDPDGAARAAFAEGYKGPGEPKLVASVDEVLALEPDLVSICSPSGLHAKHIAACFDAGVPLLWVEKPVTLDLGDYRALLERWRGMSKPPRISVNYFRRGLPQYDTLAGHIAKAGPPEVLQLDYSRRLDTNGVHLIDMAGALLGLTEAPKIEGLDARDRANPSFRFHAGNTAVEVCGMDLSYHCIDLRAVFTDRRLSVVRGGIEAYEELRVDNRDYPGFFHLDERRPAGDPTVFRTAMLDGTFRNLCNLLDYDAQLNSSLETAFFAQNVLEQVTLALSA